VSRYQTGKTNLDFTEARDSEWQWHQLDHMQVCTSLQTDNHASTPPLSFLQAGCPSCCPTNNVKALKAVLTVLQITVLSKHLEVRVHVQTIFFCDSLVPVVQFIFIVFIQYMFVVSKITAKNFCYQCYIMMFPLFCCLLLFRFTLPPSDLFDWFEPYLDDEEVKKI